MRSIRLPKALSHTRPGTSLVELSLFLAFFAVSGTVLVMFMINTTEQRAKQQTFAMVEQNGLQIMQIIGNRIRGAERILDPPIGSTGSIVALQVANETLNPTTIGIASGSIYVGEGSGFDSLSPIVVTVSDFFVHNTSSASDRSSLLVRFTVSRTIPTSLQQTYSQTFETLVRLYPDDIESTQCGCTAPVCNAGTYTWQYCESDTCYTNSGSYAC